MKKKGPSIKDIAKALNVSITTVSFVLNGKAKERRISEAVTKKILDYAKKINYTPNHLARSLRTGESKTLVFMVEDISNNYFFARVARIIEDIAHEHGYMVIFCSNDNDDDKSTELINMFTHGQIDGYIVIPSAGIKDQIQNLINDDIPVVLFDRHFPELDCNYVIINNEEAVYSGTKHLHDNGYKNIGFITVDLKQSQMQDRLLGYKKAAKDLGQEAAILEIPYDEKWTDKGIQLMVEFIKNNPQLDSLFFSTNYLTVQGLTVFKEYFPDELHQMGLLSFDDIDLFKVCTPSISAVAQPLDQIAEALMKIILDQLNKDKEVTGFQKIVLNSELHVRESSKRKD